MYLIVIKLQGAPFSICHTQNKNWCNYGTVISSDNEPKSLTASIWRHNEEGLCGDLSLRLSPTRSSSFSVTNFFEYLMKSYGLFLVESNAHMTHKSHFDTTRGSSQILLGPAEFPCISGDDKDMGLQNHFLGLI